MDNPWVILTALSHPWQAHLLKTKLESEGIATTLADEHTVSIDWLYSNVLRGVKVKVRLSDLQKAQDILNAPPPQRHLNVVDSTDDESED